MEAREPSQQEVLYITDFSITLRDQTTVDNNVAHPGI